MLAGDHRPTGAHFDTAAMKADGLDIPHLSRTREKSTLSKAVEVASDLLPFIGVVNHWVLGIQPRRKKRTAALRTKSRILSTSLQHYCVSDATLRQLSMTSQLERLRILMMEEHSACQSGIVYKDAPSKQEHHEHDALHIAAPRGFGDLDTIEFDDILTENEHDALNMSLDQDAGNSGHEDFSQIQNELSNLLSQCSFEHVPISQGYQQPLCTDTSTQDDLLYIQTLLNNM